MSTPSLSISSFFSPKGGKKGKPKNDKEKHVVKETIYFGKGALSKNDATVQMHEMVKDEKEAYESESRERKRKYAEEFLGRLTQALSIEGKELQLIFIKLPARKSGTAVKLTRDSDITFQVMELLRNAKNNAKKQAAKGVQPITVAFRPQDVI